MEMIENSSELLFQRIRTENESAMSAFHARYQDRIIRLAETRIYGILKAKIDPSDISQETFIAFFEAMRKNTIEWEKKGDLWRFLAGIAVNQVRKKAEYYSAKKRDCSVENSEVERLAISDRRSAEIELSDLLAHVLATEKPLTNRIIKLRLAGYSYIEIATKVQRADRTIRRILDSFRAKVAIELGVNFPPSDSDSNSNEVLTPEPKSPVVEYSRFQLLRMIGEGSFAKVYLAKENETGRYFAIKALKKKWIDDERVEQLFRDEQKLVSNLSGPFVARVYGMGILPSGSCFILMDWVDGKSVLGAAESESPEQVEKWIGQLQLAINHIHDKGVIHGDVKSHNVLVDSQNRIRLVDFGLGASISDATLDTGVDLAALKKLVEQIRKTVGRH